jgi:uncharacterized protein (TIGR03067 family)
MVSMIVLACGVSAGGDQQDDKSKLQGEWKLISMEASGKKKSDDALKDSKVVIKDDGWLSPGGIQFTFKIDPTKDPKHLDLSGSPGGGGLDMTWPGIYKIEGETLTFCRSLGAPGQRPSEFKAGEGIVLMVLKRAGKS